MKVITKYVALDGSEFATEAECLSYEKEGIDSNIEKVHKEIQRLKSGVLAGEFKLYMRAKNKYRQVCKEAVSVNERLQVINHYVAIKNRYHDALVTYQRHKNQLKFLKNAKIKANK